MSAPEPSTANESHHRRASSLPSEEGTPIVEQNDCITDLWASADLLFRNKLSWLLLLGPIAVIGDTMGILGEAASFTLSGIALIPCAERLSFVTEQVAEHTNGTFGALLNATFGNAPELLISIAALRSGYYRVVQLTMLGSMMTNMILVFGISCIIGGLRWQVQELRLTSGNVNVGMILLATAGFLFPAALVLSGQLPYEDEKSPDVPTHVEIVFCRVNAFVMMILYICYLIFQLGTHKEEFEDHERSDHNQHHHARKARRNLFCLRSMRTARRMVRWGPTHTVLAPPPSRGVKARRSDEVTPDQVSASDLSEGEDSDQVVMTPLMPDVELGQDVLGTGLAGPRRRPASPALSWNDDNVTTESENGSNLLRRKGSSSLSGRRHSENGSIHSPRTPARHLNSIDRHKAKDSEDGLYRAEVEVLDGEDEGSNASFILPPAQLDARYECGPVLSLRAGILWLFIITLCISALSDILVDTIDGFARRMRMSEVFTSMVVIPFFSNVAEQVSAFLFAYRNEMDLVIGVTIGSAIQIATFVLPGSVLIGMAMDRSMTLFLHSYETVCIFFSVIVVGAVLQGGTTNWLVGGICVGCYIIMATGIWFHEIENLTVDGEVAIRNVTLT